MYNGKKELWKGTKAEGGGSKNSIIILSINR